MNTDAAALGGDTKMIHVIVVDDQAMVRGALATLIGLEPDIHVVGQAATGQEALDLVRHLESRGTHVDVAIMDVEMPVLDGIATTARLKMQHPDVKVLMVTTFGRPGYVQRAIESGASGFIVKDTPASQLSQAIRKVVKGERVVDSQLAVDSLLQGTSPLSERETEVLTEVAKGGTIDDIAATLHLSSGTVRNHISSAITKTQARTRAEAASIARERGWL
ncbi:MAG: response regulator transcription factor [Actinomycetaceae bacterium]|nr:response regulator transcription factor [Actinomycetaceae bacterium]